MERLTEPLFESMSVETFSIIEFQIPFKYLFLWAICFVLLLQVTYAHPIYIVYNKFKLQRCVHLRKSHIPEHLLPINTTM